MEPHSFDYVIYHKNCLDGFSAFVVLTGTGTISNNATIYPDMPSANEAPPNIDGKRIIIIDVAYKRDVIEEIFSRAASVLFIDHHITIKNDVITLIKLYEDKHIMIYDEHLSGASLTWKYFYPDDPVPRWIKYIQDNDIGTWKYKFTRQFILALQIKYRLNLSRDTIKRWNKLYDNNEVKRLIRSGHKYMEYQSYLMDHFSHRYTLELFPSQMVYDDYKDFFTRPGQYMVAVVNGGCPDNSILGNKIATDVDCDLVLLWTFHLDKKQYVISFRSLEVDVGKIAKAFGGGGHTLASSCVIPLSKYNITDLFFPQSLPRY